MKPSNRGPRLREDGEKRRLCSTRVWFLDVITKQVRCFGAGLCRTQPSRFLFDIGCALCSPSPLSRTGGAPRCILYFKTHPLSSSIASLVASIAHCDGRQRCRSCKRVKCVKPWQCYDRTRLETRFSTLTHVHLVDI